MWSFQIFSIVVFIDFAEVKDSWLLVWNIFYNEKLFLGAWEWWKAFSGVPFPERLFERGLNNW